MIKIKPESLYLGEYHLGWVSYFSVIHVLWLAGVYFAVMYFSWTVIAITAFAVVQYFYVHLGITLGPHRYYAHHSYEAKAWFKYFVCGGFSGSFQGAIFYWAMRHRHHHVVTDQAGVDPHTPKDGFWHAHCLWVMKRRGLASPPLIFGRPFFKRPELYTVGKWQTDNHWLLCTLMAFVLPTFVGILFAFMIEGISYDSLFHGAVGGFLIGGCVRLVFQYHLTWIVNSYGHRHHDIGGDSGSSASVSGFLGKVLAVLTFGESNHREHHDKPRHYRIGRLKGQIDPGAAVLELMERLGVCWDLVRDEPVKTP